MRQPPKGFFRLAFKRQGWLPHKMTLDGYQASHRVAVELLSQHPRGKRTKILSSKCLNNLMGQDYRSIKLRSGPMLGLKRFRNSSITIAGVELIHRIRKGRFKLGTLRIKDNAAPAVWNAVLAASANSDSRAFDECIAKISTGTLKWPPVGRLPQLISPIVHPSAYTTRMNHQIPGSNRSWIALRRLFTACRASRDSLQFVFHRVVANFPCVLDHEIDQRGRYAESLGYFTLRVALEHAELECALRALRQFRESF